MKILMVASEATPFCKTGGLADVIGALPAALVEKSVQVAVVLPGYRDNKYRSPLREVYKNLEIPLAGGYTVNIFETVERGVTFYIAMCPQLYNRDGIYNVDGLDFSDNAVRFAVLCCAAVGVVRNLFRPDIIHCHDWQSALLPVYVRRIFHGDPVFFGVRLLFTIHNLGYQGLFDRSVGPQIGLDPGVFTPELMEFFGSVNFLKGAIHYSDAVTTVSPTYAREIQTAELGFGLDTYLRTHAKLLTGILNGVDYAEWNPETDPYIATHYSAEDLSGKRECRKALLKEFGLPNDSVDRPLVGIVSRLVSQKGFDLIAAIANQLLDLELSMAVLGTGELLYQDLFRTLAASWPERVGVRIGYDNAMAHRIEAGSDMFLMPSRYEPSGLNQIYSLRYGTIPIVRATGGLDDSIDEETGFKFQDYSGAALLRTIGLALEAFGDREAWQVMMRRAMLRDFGWSRAADRYVELYRRLLAG